MNRPDPDPVFSYDHPARTTPALAETVTRIDDMVSRQSPMSHQIAAHIALNAAYHGYRAGYAQATRDVMSASEVAAQLGISVQAVTKNAQRNGFGQVVGPTRVYWPADVENMRARMRRIAAPELPHQQD